MLNVVIVKKGENDLAGLIDIEKPRMRGLQKASKIRKLFNVLKEGDLRKHVNTHRRTVTIKVDEFLIYCYSLLHLFLFQVESRSTLARIVAEFVSMFTSLGKKASKARKMQRLVASLIF